MGSLRGYFVCPNFEYVSILYEHSFIAKSNETKLNPSRINSTRKNETGTRDSSSVLVNAIYTFL